MTDSVPGSSGEAKYRLPPSLGGGEFVGEFGGYELGQYRYVGHIEGVGGTFLGLPHPLEEIKPPSIDDPEPLPLVLHAAYGGQAIDVILVEAYDGAQLKLDNGVSLRYANLDATALRLLARAAWQRADAIEGGAS